MKKLLVSDFDGTINIKETISKEDIEAIRRFKEDNAFAIATGRSITSLNSRIKDTGIEYDHCIACNGALLTDEKNRCISRMIIERNTAIDIIGYIRNTEAASYDVSDGIHTSVTLLVDKDEHPYREHYDSLYGSYDGDEKKMIRDDTVCQISAVFYNNRQAEGFAAYISRKYKDVTAHVNINDVDVVNKDADKANALEELLKSEEYQKVYTIGDSLNDLQMIRNHHGFAMKGSDERVKAYARRTVTGIKECIDIIMNKRKIILCSDIDGTLLRKYDGINSDVLAEDIEAVHRLIDSGHDFALVSGRGLEACREFSRQYGIDPTYFISSSGGQITDKDGSYLYREKISKEDGLAIIDLIGRCDVESYEVSDGSISSLTILDMNRISAESALRKNSKAFTGDEKKIIENDQIIQISVHFFDETVQAEFIECLAERNIDVLVHINNLDIDITSSSCSKYRAIEYLNDLNDYRNVYCIGDGLNDLEMIEKYTGFAVENAVEEVKRKARKTVSGICECIEMIMEKENEN